MSTDAIAEELIERALSLGMRLGTAESLTGGLLADAIVAVPGASRVFSGGIVAYDTALKHSLLGVDAALLAARGPVDPEVARQMARGVRVACAIAGMEAGIGVSTTGVAGPDPDAQTGQGVGTVWVGVSSILGERAVRAESSATSRPAIRRAAVAVALEEIVKELFQIAES